MPNQNKNLSIYFPLYLSIVYVIGLLFWKLLFITFNDVDDVFGCVLAGARLDFSMICGVFLIGFLPYWMYLIFGNSFWVTILKIINIILWIFVCIVEFSSILIYKEWGSTLDQRAISYLLHPQEAWASVRDFIPWSMVFFGLIISVSGVKKIHSLFAVWQLPKQRWKYTILALLIGGLAFLGLRGGWQKLPIVPSYAFYSNEMKNNFAATNKVWYFLYSIVKSGSISTHYTADDIEAFAEHYQSNRCLIDTLHQPLKDKHIVLITMEGWSADMVGYLYGKENVTPFFDSLSQESIRFTNAFSSGFRTDQGLMSLLSGLPSVQSVNMPNIVDKVKRFPSLVASMKENGRQTSFIYGGDLNFSNLYNYLTISGFDTIIRDKDFDSGDRLTEWGVPDHITANKAIDVISSHKKLFFSMVLFLSSHAPFDVPIPNELTQMEGHQNQYKSSVRYSDEALKQFFKLAKQTNWYQNTIFIITSDHGSTHSGWAKMEDHNRFRIPLIVFDPGHTISIDKKIIHQPCNHFDLPMTICQLSGAKCDAFVFGRDIFCNDPERCAYWNVDVAAATFCQNNQSISSQLSKIDQEKSQAILFVDMIKSWLNHQ